MLDNDRQPTTQREALETGRHGDFHQALFKAATSGSVHDLMEAYARADESNQAKLDEVFPEGLAICRRIYNDWPGRRGWPMALARKFPHLAGDLDEPFADRLRVMGHDDGAAAPALRPGGSGSPAVPRPGAIRSSARALRQSGI